MRLEASASFSVSESGATDVAGVLADVAMVVISGEDLRAARGVESIRRRLKRLPASLVRGDSSGIGESARFLVDFGRGVKGADCSCSSTMGSEGCRRAFLLDLVEEERILRWHGVAVSSSGSGERAAFLLRAEGVMGTTSVTSFSSLVVACFDTRVKLLIGAVAGVAMGFLRGRPRGRPKAPAIMMDNDASKAGITVYYNSTVRQVRLRSCDRKL